ncbi:stage II sporulation protein R [Tepidimicrobium xylanilyticum]|uniref:Stage II sporulation protein R n=2 Tax=Tepidimicrobium xylanilyticum TaxID=1123352 RepID=A0A1H2WH05_9FIRM|nr:stage II sporulation protein R [Tepidimicrobium xylanilyticum]
MIQVKKNLGGINMKFRKGIICLVLLFVFIYLIQPYEDMEEPSVEGFKDNIIRFHIVANSDKEEDQLLKLKVRDELLKETQVKFENSKSLDETRSIINENLNYIKSLAEEVIKREGKNFPVEVHFGNINFPTRKYGDIVLPAGEYETLQVTIGEGKGKNWWCVMFPPLCFVDANHSHAVKSDQDLKKTIIGEDTSLLHANKEPPIILKSKVVEVYQKTKTYLADFLAKK